MPMSIFLVKGELIETELEPFPHFGCCPECLAEGFVDERTPAPYLNVGSDHYFICETHKVFWYVGSNLFSAWREQSEAGWEKNKKILEGYRKVEEAVAWRPVCKQPGQGAYRQVAVKTVGHDDDLPF